MVPGSRFEIPTIHYPLPTNGVHRSLAGASVSMGERLDGRAFKDGHDQECRMME